MPSWVYQDLYDRPPLRSKNRSHMGPMMACAKFSWEFFLPNKKRLCAKFSWKFFYLIKRGLYYRFFFVGKIRKRLFRKSFFKNFSWEFFAGFFLGL